MMMTYEIDVTVNLLPETLDPAQAHRIRPRIGIIMQPLPTTR